MDIVYEVNLFIDREIETEYREWLVKHIADILALPGFLGARSFDVRQDDTSHGFALCVQYRLASQAALDDYFVQHAPRLRAEGIEKFGDRFTASRRVLVNSRVFS